MYMVLRGLFLATVLWLTVPSILLAQGSVPYKFSGVYTWGKIVTMLCEDGWCRTALPRDFYQMEVPISIYEDTFDNAFKALRIQALADGYILTKSGKKKPYEVSVRKKDENEAGYISCLDSAVHIVPDKYLSMYRRADSLKCSAPKVDTLSLGDSLRIVPLDRFRINFYVVSSSYLDNYGVDWTELWATGNLWSNPHFISDWALRAVSEGDSLSEFRSIEIDIDSSASLHWGSQKREEKSTYQTGETVRTDYEYHDYGLTLKLSRSERGGIRGEYSLAQRDDMNSIIEGNFGGGGKDSVSTFGVFDSYQVVNRGIPILRSIPVLGTLFGTTSRDKVKSFFVIEIVQLRKVVDNPSHFDFLDSLKNEELNYDVYDSTQDQPDTLSNIQDSEVIE